MLLRHLWTVNYMAWHLSLFDVLTATFLTSFFYFAGTLECPIKAWRATFWIPSLLTTKLIVIITSTCGGFQCLIRNTNPSWDDVYLYAVNKYKRWQIFLVFKLCKILDLWKIRLVSTYSESYMNLYKHTPIFSIIIIIISNVFYLEMSMFAVISSQKMSFNRLDICSLKMSKITYLYIFGFWFWGNHFNQFIQMELFDIWNKGMFTYITQCWAIKNIHVIDFWHGSNFNALLEHLLHIPPRYSDILL